MTGGEAARWLGEAARQGLADAQFSLGWLYERGGNGVPPDDVGALRGSPEPRAKATRMRSR